MRSLIVLLLVPAVASSDAPKVEKLEPKAVAALVEKGSATLVDVREEEEVTSGMAKPAKWFPLSKVKADPAAFKAFLAALPKGGKVVFYCAAGARAGQAAELGFKATSPTGRPRGIMDRKSRFTNWHGTARSAQRCGVAVV